MKNKIKFAMMTAIVGLSGTTVLADDTQSTSPNATYALAIESNDGKIEKLITIGGHDACMNLVEQAEKPHKLLCVTTAPVASQ